ncbi:MAG: excinuclease ABC subunit UvrC [Candidatus Falkowbacteria bacterium]
MLTSQNIKDLGLPATPGSYQFFNSKGQIIYVGKAVNLLARVSSYWRDSANLTPAKARMLTEIERVEWKTVDSEIEALLLEANLIKKYQPAYNVLLRDDKRFSYIKVSLEDEVPGLFAVRQLDQSGKYYGPFVSGRAVRETLKALRRIWPYCTTRKVAAKPCFYYQIGRCLGACGGLVTRAEYMKQVIKPIIAFLDGKKDKVVADMERQAKRLAKAGDEEGAARINWQIRNMREVLEGTRVLSVGEKYENDVVELAKVLQLAKVPQRIEGYDLSNIFSQQAVGSMVVFAGGEPDKSQYRKFKIKGSVLGDTEMLSEIFERRLGNDWPLPDLIIIDGGKAQLNTVTRILKKHKLDILAISISKGEGLRSAMAPDKLFFPGQALPLELPLASPALHLVKRVRDEAHRFAIGFHRDARSKHFLSGG